MKRNYFFAGILGGALLMTLFIKEPFASQQAVKSENIPPEPVTEVSAVQNEASTLAGVPTTSPSSKPTEADTPAATAEKTVPSYTKDTLVLYDGQNADLPIYIAFEGDVYDVTAGREFYQPGGKYHFLAGTDGTKLLRMFGGDLIKEKYPVVGTYR